MYSQESITHRRSVRTYGAVSGRSRKGSSQEQIRLLQLAVCLVLFLAISLWKGIFPQKLNQVKENLLVLITTDLDFREPLAALGASLAEGDSMLSDLGAFCVEVFGTDKKAASAEPEAAAPQLLPIPSEKLLDDELHFLSLKDGAAACTAHYTDFSRYGLTVLDPEPEEFPAEQGVSPSESVAQQEPDTIPTVGTVVMYANYSGEALPNNYTMDQISLGGLETVTPVMGHLNSEYGYRDHPINGRYLFHGGIDIGGQNGDPIGAFAAGTVEYIGEDDSYGQYFQIDHGNGVKSFYAHCRKILVTKGQTVALGEKVAEIGSSGSATGPHLHLELKYNKLHLNPVYYVDFLEQ